MSGIPTLIRAIRFPQTNFDTSHKFIDIPGFNQRSFSWVKRQPIRKGHTIAHSTYFIFTCARMSFPRGIQVDRGKSAARHEANFEGKIISLCSNRKPSKVVWFFIELLQLGMRYQF